MDHGKLFARCQTGLAFQNREGDFSKDSAICFQGGRRRRGWELGRSRWCQLYSLVPWKQNGPLRLTVPQRTEGC